jgi:hypothetical protein
MYVLVLNKQDTFNLILAESWFCFVGGHVEKLSLCDTECTVCQWSEWRSGK